MARQARLSEADRAAWAKFAHSIRPLLGVALPDVHLTHEVGEATARSDTGEDRSGTHPHPSRPVRRPLPHPGEVMLAIGDAPAGLDSATWQQFRTGKLVATRKLDLHGMTAQRAFHALAAFLRASHAERMRCVEVVTGRGSGDGTGVIRREFPLWLNQPTLRPLVLAATYPHAANPGAVRLLLRRAR